ncbi:MAG: DUF4388 domain-containing protein [candidate division NC10 bacterium]|nr:DUF4388 domain-containing protein [candidate division NC10 bacterium]
MALEGSFKDFHIADVLQLIGLQQKTGVLSLETAEESLQLLLRDGEVVGVQSARPPLETRVAALLIARGSLTPAALEEALAVQREQAQPLGAILTAGAVPGKEWASALAAELEGRLYRPFRWKDGKYRFTTQGKVEPGENSLPPLRVDTLLMEGMRRADEWPLILQEVHSPKAVFRVGGQQAKVDPRDIRPTDVTMLKLVDGKRTVEELVALSGLGEFEAWSGLANLVRANAISPVSLGPAAPTEDAAPPRAAAVRPIRRAPVQAQAAPPAWAARAAWAAAAACLAAVLAVFGGEPLGLFPASSDQQRSLDRVRVLRALEELQALARRVEAVSVWTGRNPGSLEALATLGPIGRGLLTDPWGQPYRLETGGERVWVVSAGPDRRPGTPDDLRL